MTLDNCIDNNCVVFLHQLNLTDCTHSTVTVTVINLNILTDDTEHSLCNLLIYTNLESDEFATEKCKDWVETWLEEVHINKASHSIFSAIWLLHSANYKGCDNDSHYHPDNILLGWPWSCLQHVFNWMYIVCLLHMCHNCAGLRTN